MSRDRTHQFDIRIDDPGVFHIGAEMRQVPYAGVAGRPPPGIRKWGVPIGLPHTHPIIRKATMDEFERIMIGKKISFEVSTAESDWDNQHTRKVQAKVKESQNGIIMAEDMEHPDYIYTLTYDPKYVTLET